MTLHTLQFASKNTFFSGGHCETQGITADSVHVSKHEALEQDPIHWNKSDIVWTWFGRAVA